MLCLGDDGYLALLSFYRMIREMFEKENVGGQFYNNQLNTTTQFQITNLKIYLKKKHTTSSDYFSNRVDSKMVTGV